MYIYIYDVYIIYISSVSSIFDSTKAWESPTWSVLLSTRAGFPREPHCQAESGPLEGSKLLSKSCQFALAKCFPKVIECLILFNA